MRDSWLTMFISAGIFLAIAGETQAQPLVAHAESIECTVANADLVFVAQIIKVGREQENEVGKFYETTIDIQETLKQGLFLDEPYRKLSIWLPYPAVILANWQAESDQLLVTVNEDAPYATRAVSLSPEKLEILTADFQLLRDPAQVIRIAKEAVSRLPAPVKRLHTFCVSVPREVIIGTRWEAYHGLTLSVPVDDQLEKWAQAGSRSKNYMTREESARALRYFKSDDNIAQVKMLLNDPGWAIVSHVQENDGIEERFFGVRHAAFETLKAWGVKTEPPVFRAEVKP